jgi:hypothetical protein
MKRLFLCLCLVCFGLIGCDEQSQQAQSASGVTKANVTVTPGSDGLTVEQRNVRDRLVEDNKPGAIKHLYVISPYSGQVILYSTVRGKVTSGGKRLTPTQASSFFNQQDREVVGGFRVNMQNGQAITNEVLQDDGTYGTSGDYLYWWDVRGIYHQHYLTGGQIVHVSSQPIPVKSVIINIEAGQQ